MVLGLVAVMMFNLVDTMFVGRLGARPLAAMSFTFPVVFFVMSIAMGMGVGVLAVVSRVIGEGDRNRVKRITTDGLILANVMVVAVALLGVLTIDPLFRALGAEADTLPLIRDYMQIWYVAIGFLVIPMVGNSAIRATGDTKTPSLVMVIAGLMNVIFDPLLIFGIGPFPRLELQGAAISTAVSWTVTFTAALWILGRRERMLSFVRPSTAQVMQSWREILHIGLPAIGMYVLVPISGGIFTRMAAGFGHEAVAAFGVGQRVEAVTMIGVAAVYTALSPFVGQNYGARNCDRIRHGFAYSIRTALIYGAVAAGVLALAAPFVAAIFSEDELVRHFSVRYFWLVPLSYALRGVVQLSAGLFTGLNQPGKAIFVMLLRMIIFAVPAGWIGARVAGVGGVYFGVAAGNLLAGVVSLVMARRYMGQVETELGEAPPEAASSPS